MPTTPSYHAPTIDDPADELRRTISRLYDRCRPEPVLLVSEWADAHRILPSKGSAEPGPWRTSRTPYLKAILDALSTGSPYHTVVFAKGAQIGAPLALDTPIPTPCGWKQMGELLPGDQVFGLDGRPANVVGVSETFSDRQCFLVTFSDGESIVADADHLWTVDVAKSSATDNGKVTLRTGEMYGNDKKSRRRLHFKRGNRHRYAIPVTQPLDLPEVDLPIEPYLLGYWLGNGHHTNNRLSVHDDDGQEIAGYLSDVSVEKREWHKGKVSDIVIHAAGFTAALKQIGVFGDKHIPAQYLRASIGQRQALLQGLMDADGHAGVKGRCELTLALKRLFDDALELVRSLGFKPSVSERIPARTRIHGRPVPQNTHYRLDFMAYDDFPAFRLMRKRNRLLSKSGRRTSETFRRRIVDITPVPSVPTRCIAVDTPDHLFLAGKGMIATHNTEAGSNWLGYCIHHAPAPMLMVQPTIDMVKRISKQRVQPMIEVTPVLAERIAPSRARDAGNTLQQKDFAGGTLVMTGANSATGLRSMPARYLFLDEVDAYPGDVEGEGDPIELAIARTATFKRNRKIFMCSTPTIEGESRIWKAFQETDQRYYHVPCPDCHGKQIIDWTRIIWEEGNPESAALTCQHCGVLIDERHKGWMLDNGEWTATAEGLDSGMVGFHLSSLYSPPGWYSWGDAAKDFIKAKGHSTKLQSFINTKLGQCWEDRSGEKVDHETLMARREAWDVHAIPTDVALITAGVDVQDDRLEVSLIGWTGSEQARVLDHLQLWGAPGEAQLWTELDNVLLGQFTCQDGRVLRIRSVAIDTGGHHTQRAYEFCRGRASRKVFPVKGRAGNHPVWPNKTTKTKLSQGVQLYLVGVDTAKDQLRSALAVSNPDRPRAVSFAADLPDSYFVQLTSEKRVTTYNKSGVAVRAWKKPPGARNEALDCFVYALAALESLKQAGVRLKVVAQQAGALIKPVVPTQTEAAPPEVEEAMPAAQPPRPAMRKTRRQSSALI